MRRSALEGAFLFFLALSLLFNSSYAFTPMLNFNGITLGSTYEDVINAWGKPERVIGEYINGCGLLNFKKDFLQANFVYGRLWTLTIQFDAVASWRNGISIRKANTVGNYLLLPDSKFMRQYRLGNDLGFVYRSLSLIPLFQPNDFYDSVLKQNVPGQFLVVYRLNQRGKVERLSISVGNNP